MSVARFESLADYMSAEKLSDDALAQILNISRVHVNRLRLGRRRPSLALAIRLEEITGIPASKFAEAPSRDRRHAEAASP